MTLQRQHGCQYFGVALLTMGVSLAQAAQFGPTFPSHRFPTNESYHLGYGFAYGKSSGNFVSARSIEPLVDKAQLRLLRQQLTFEYQPSRRFAAGSYLVFDSLRLSSSETEESVTNSKLGDQRAYFEYRFKDEPGHSLGLAVMLKFPLYSNPTFNKLPSDGSSIAMLGDAQTDISALFTSEFWKADLLRFRFDAGYTYRTEKYSSEIPLMTSFGIVTPKMDLEVKLLGNFTMSNDSFEDTNTDIESVRERFAYSEYTYSAKPWVIAVEPEITYWFSKNWGAQSSLRYALFGNSSASFFTVLGGITYRWSRTDKRVRRTLQEVDLEIDQDAGVFPGEKAEDL